MPTIGVSNDARRISRVHGGSLPSSVVPNTLTEILTRAATSSPLGLHYITLKNGEHVQSYQSLLEEAKQIASWLANSGVRPQDKVILQLQRPADFLVSFWGCVVGGFVAVPMAVPPVYDPVNLQSRWLRSALTVLRTPFILTTRQFIGPISELFQDQPEKKLQISSLEGIERFTCDSVPHQSSINDVAAILLTSGSTASPKFVRLSHLNFFSSIAGSAFLHGLETQDVSFNWLPLHHVSALMRSIRDVYAGCKQFQAITSEILADPLRWIDWIDQHRVTMSWAPNFAFGLVAEAANRYNGRTWNLECVRSITAAGEPVLQNTVNTFGELLKPFGLRRNTLQVSWGMTEACFGTCSLDSFRANEESHSRFANVGTPIPGLSIRITDSEDRPLQEGVQGNLQISGPVVTTGYFESPELNKENFTEDGWLKTGDLGVIRDGILTITGREKDLIIVNGVKYSTQTISGIVETIAGVVPLSVAVCIMRAQNVRTEGFLVFFQPECSEEAWPDLIRQIRLEIHRKMGIAPLHVIPLHHSFLPRSSGGKILRTELLEQFDRGEFHSILTRVAELTNQMASREQSDQTPIEQMVAQCFSEVLNLSQVGLNNNFFELGGGSIHAMQLASRLAELFPDKDVSPIAIFSNPTVRQLAAHLRGSIQEVDIVEVGTGRAAIRKNRWQQRRNAEEQLR